jgi:trehalose synthase
VSRANAKGLLERVRPRDVVLLHDPQAAGLVDAVRHTGAKVVWRCHVGSDVPNAHTARCWGFLRPYLEGADALVFSTPRHVPGWVEPGRAHVIAPSIDPFSAKNFEMDRSTVRRILVRVGLLRGAGEPPAPLVARVYGSPIRIRRRADVIRYGPGPSHDAPLVVQVSRWDRLKDMLGVMRAFAEHVDPSRGAHLALVGPEVGGVADDPEARGMLEECYADWLELPPEKRRRIQLVCLPMEDLEENAAVVNAVQRHAAVVVQKSLAEGFGLTVTEAMWKGRPVVASAVGGITDQVVHGEHGLLVEDPTDLRAFADAIDLLLGDPCCAEELGRSARSRVIDRFLGDRHLAQYANLLERLASV